MKITDQIETFDSDDGSTLTVSSDTYGTHDNPSLFIQVEDESRDNRMEWTSDDQDTIIEIIKHMAKMGGLDVSVKERFESQYKPGDRVRSLCEDTEGQVGTVLRDTDDQNGWNVAVRLDGDTDYGLYTYSELEPVTKSS